MATTLSRFIAKFIFASAILIQCSVSVAQNIKIGMLLPLTGQYAAIGQDNKQGIDIAKLEIDPTLKIDFLFADSKADSTQAVSEFRKLSDVNGVIGMFAFRGPVGMAINPLSLNAKLALLGGVGNKNFVLNNEYAFQLWVRSDVEGEFLAAQLHKLGRKKIAVVTVQDDWPVAVSNGFKSKAEEQGISIVYDQEILPTDTDFRSQVAKINTLKPDSIFLNVGLNQIGVF